MLIDINEIIVNDRIRKDFGNLEELAEEVGDGGENLLEEGTNLLKECADFLEETENSVSQFHKPAGDAEKEQRQVVPQPLQLIQLQILQIAELLHTQTI